MGRAWLLLALLAGVATGCAAAPRAYEAALARWRATAPTHYILSTAENLYGSPCAQTVEVRDEELVQILGNTCRHPSLWTVSWLFHKAVPPSLPEEPCVSSVAGIGCICRLRSSQQVEYDPQQGYPLSIVITETWYRAWADLSAWHYMIRQLALPNCTPPAQSPGWTIRVRELRPLP